MFSKPVHAVRAGVALPVPTMAFPRPSLAATMCTAPYRCSKPVHAVRVGVALPVPAMAFSRPSLAATVCTAPYAEAACKRAETIFSAQCAV